MTQKEYSNTHSRNPIPQIHGANAQPSDSAVGGAQESDIGGPSIQRTNKGGTGVQRSENCGPDIQRSDNGGPGVQQSNRPVNTGEVTTWNTLWRYVSVAVKRTGSVLTIAHLISLMGYSIIGIASSSGDEANLSGAFIYGSSTINLFAYVLLYFSEVDKFPFSIFEKGEKDSMGTYCAKVGIMGIILPVFNFIGLIVMSKKDERDELTFDLGIAAFVFYLLSNTLLLFRKRTNTGSEEHELRENNPPAGNSTANDALTDNLPAPNQLMDNTPADNASTADLPAADSPVDNAQVDNLRAGSSPVDNSPADSLPSLNPPVDNSRVSGSRAGSSPASN